MKNVIFAAFLILSAQFCFGQADEAPKNVYVRETIDLTKEYNNQKSKPGLVLLGTSKSGYKIYVDNTDGKSNIVVKSPEGNPVVTVGRRKYIQTTEGLACFECTDIRRNGHTEEACYEVVCTAIDKLANSAQKKTH
jgi:hypothetical protein